MEKIIIQGIKYDTKSSFMHGSAEAPEEIRKILNNGSSNYSTENGMDIRNINVVDMGDFLIDDYFDIYDITKQNIQKFDGPLLTLGGDHSISYPIVKALTEKVGIFHILHVDAHSDLYEEFEGDKYSHACPFARILEEGLSLSLTQVGIRTLNDHQRAQARKYDVIIQEMKDWNISSLDIMGPLYLSIDMDAFDPAFAPGVSHHEPGGLSSRQVIDLIHKIDVKIIGADIVEYNPKRDLNQMTAALAAKLMKEIISSFM